MGRDSYISSNSGGLKSIHQPAYHKRTFYNGLRNYPATDNFAKRGRSSMATFEEKNDVFSKSQDHWHKGFKREMNLMKNYQAMMDDRLSVPKKIKKVNRNVSTIRNKSPGKLL